MGRLKKFRIVESSNLNQVYYDRRFHHLYIEFKSGTTYRYTNVSYYRYHMLMNSESKGKYFNRYIKGKYDYERID
jgi:lysyl-tRNA synthetase class 2